MQVNCDNRLCIYNIANACVRTTITIVSGECQHPEYGESTGEIVDVDPIPLVEPEPTAYKNVQTKTAYRTEEDYERD